MSELERAVIDHYEGQLARHGPSARGMDWKDEASQRLRFELLCDVCDLDGLRILEVGCGAAHLLDYLNGQRIRASYSGIDLSPAMVAAAREGHQDADIRCANLLTDAIQPADVVLCSGAFHVKLDTPADAWREHLERSLERMYDLCRLAMSFNLMSDQVDYRNQDLYYANPGDVLDFCRRKLGRRVALRHDYPLFEFTVHVYHDEAS